MNEFDSTYTEWYEDKIGFRETTVEYAIEVY